MDNREVAKRLLHLAHMLVGEAKEAFRIEIVVERDEGYELSARIHENLPQYKRRLPKPSNKLSLAPLDFDQTYYTNDSLHGREGMREVYTIRWFDTYMAAHDMMMKLTNGMFIVSQRVDRSMSS